MVIILSNVYEDDSVRIVTEPIETENPILIEGFPGIGLVGNIASQQIIDKMNMTYKGSIESKYFPPIVVLYQGLVTMPVRVYESKEYNLLLVVSDIPINPSVSYDISKALVGWSKSINVKEVVSIAGITTMEESEGTHVFGAATNREMLDKIRDHIEVFNMGTISGISGNVMSECLMRDLPAVSLLGSTQTQNPDPRASAAVLEVLNSLYGLSINTEELFEQAEKIEAEMQRLAEDVKSSEQQPGYRKEFPMYG
ncbi:proteasome assembly chaperone family protein [Methanohalobium sp.]|uniref:proteasome assembly chaperone family protein n=1 Tax=Methanohalobium sp. TaxID=2837493 RepID=UPI0025EF518D|nr:proteasome assembly chaperone family protein [Methanohalobium sp.]